MHIDLLAPNICISCERPAMLLPDFPGFCHICLQNLPWRYNRTRITFACENVNKVKLPLLNDNDLPVYAVCDYISCIRKCLLELKFAKRTGLATPLASLLVATVRNKRIPVDAVLGVPLHPIRLKERGYNQADLLAHETAAILRCANLSGLLLRRKNTQRQSEQADRQARLHNLQNAFCLNAKRANSAGKILKDRRILLIDDVATTGITLIEAAKPLLKVGARVNALVVASDHD